MAAVFDADFLSKEERKALFNLLNVDIELSNLVIRILANLKFKAHALREDFADNADAPLKLEVLRGVRRRDRREQSYGKGVLRVGEGES